MTAWQDLLPQLPKSNYIYEFDLKGFFDSVNLCYLKKILLITGIPAEISEYIIRWNQTLPHRSPRHGITWRTPLEEASDYKYSQVGIPLIGFSDYTYWINRKRCEEILNPLIRDYEYYRGVSQGMPTSPLLSTLLLAPLLTKPQESIVLYADDGIILSQSPITPPQFPDESGISLNLEKSHHVKRSGKWLRDMKFLGITYTYSPDAPKDSRVNSGTLMNNTRTPKTFTLDKLEAFYHAGYYVNYEGVALETFDNWFNQKIAGYLQSRLYLGGYHDGDVMQEFAYNYEPKSWSELEMRRLRGNRSKGLSYLLHGNEAPELTIFNSSSFANQSLSRWLKTYCPYKNGSCLPFPVTQSSLSGG